MHLMFFTQGKTIHGLGSTLAHKKCCPSLQEFGAKMDFLELWRGNAETGNDCPGGEGFPYKEWRSYFQEEVKLAKVELEDCNWYMFSFLDMCFSSMHTALGWGVRCGPGQWGCRHSVILIHKSTLLYLILETLFMWLDCYFLGGRKMLSSTLLV